MLSRRSPKPIFLTYGPILPAIAKTPRTAWNKRSMTLARLSPKPFARPFPPRPHNPPASFLDADPLSQLHRRLSARDGSPSGCRRSPRKKGYSAHPETAPLTRQPDRAGISITNCRRRQLVIEMTARSGCRVNGAVSGCAEYPFFRGERRQPEGEPSRADKRRCSWDSGSASRNEAGGL